MTDTARQKAALRKKARGFLAALNLEEIAEQAVATLGGWPVLAQAHAVAAYWPMADEINLLPLLRQQLALGKRLYLPVWHGEAMDLVRVMDLDNLPGRWVGKSWVCAPQTGEVYEGDSPLLAFVPALALDRAGYRLGRGGGLYDRYLARGLPLTTVGVAPQALIWDELPREAHDQPLDFVGVEGLV